MRDEPVSSGNIQEATIQTIPTSLTTFSSGKHRLPLRNDVISTPQNTKSLQVASTGMRGINPGNN